MYSIPLSLLTKTSKIINESDIQESQNFCKLFSKAKLSYDNKSEDLKLQHTKNLQSNIWQWLDNLPLEEKIKICTIKNKWLIKILIQLSFFHFIDRKTRFEPISDMNMLFANNQNLALLNQNYIYFQNCRDTKKKFGYNEDDYYNLYFNMKKGEYIKKSKNITIDEEMTYQNKLFNIIVFLSLEDEFYLDSISLKEESLKDIKTLKQIMNYFSNKECFKDMIEPLIYNNNYYFYFPVWLHKKSELSFCEIITGIFEQQILISYEYYLFTKKKYFFQNSELILDIYKENKNLENFFLTRNKTPDKIISIELIKEMISSLKSNVGYKKMIENCKKINDQIKKDYYKTEFYIGDNILTNEEENIYNEIITEINSNKDKENGINYLINKISFMKLNDFGYYREFIFMNLRKYYIEIMKKEIINELLNINNDDNKTTKKKKKKKKKNKNNNSNNNNINININIENNFSSNDEHENNNNINSNSDNSLKIKEISENKENIKIKEEKSKNKEFFLFSTNTKKNKNKNKIHENIPNEKSFSEKNNIKINYLNNKQENDGKKEENKTIIKSIAEELKEKEKIEPQKIIKSQSNIELYKETPTISFEMINSKNDKNENKIHNNQSFINSPESITSFSFESSTKDKSIIPDANSNKNNIEENNKNPNQINMTINIINNQYIYQQYPLFNFNFNNFALMQSQFLYYYHVPSDAFLEILSKEIKIYESFTTKNIEILDKIRKKYFIKVEKLIQTGLSKKYEIKFGHYGSFFTNLSIEGSDVDIRVYYKPLKPNLDFLKDIINLLNSHLNEFDNINPILSASVPVINLQINISQEINYDTLKFMSYFEKKDISHINIDLTFTSDEKEFKRPEEIVNYINKNVKNYEDIRPLLLVIKRYFRIMKMNKSFTGGLSSYSLFLLILAFLKNCEEKMNLGKLLYYFMEKYSFYDFKNYGIDVEGKDLYYPLDNIIKESDIQNSENYDDISEHARTEEIKILDPLTKLNVAKSSFRLDEIKNTFNKALYFLKFESWKYQNEGEENIFIDDFNIIRKLFTIK